MRLETKTLHFVSRLPIIGLWTPPSSSTSRVGLNKWYMTLIWLWSELSRLSAWPAQLQTSQWELPTIDVGGTGRRSVVCGRRWRISSALCLATMRHRSWNCVFEEVQITSGGWPAVGFAAHDQHQRWSPVCRIVWNWRRLGHALVRHSQP